MRRAVAGAVVDVVIDVEGQLGLVVETKRTEPAVQTGVDVEGACLTPSGLILPLIAAHTDTAARDVGVVGVVCTVAAVSHEADDDSVGPRLF